MKFSFKNSSFFQKAVFVISIIVNLSVVVLAVLQILDVFKNAAHLFVPLLGVSMLCQAYREWNTSRKVAYFSIGAAVIIFACAIAVFCIK